MRPGVIFLLLIMGLSPEEAIRRVSLCVNLRSFKVIQCKLIEIGRLPIEIRGVYPGGGRAISHIFKSGGLKDWLFKLIRGAWIVIRIGLREKRR